MSSRNEDGRRYRDAREDASVGSIESSIEKTYGLPEGSVVIQNPNGRDARSDKHIGTLRENYKDN